SRTCKVMSMAMALRTCRNKRARGGHCRVVAGGRDYNEGGRSRYGFFRKIISESAAFSVGRSPRGRGLAERKHVPDAGHERARGGQTEEPPRDRVELCKGGEFRAVRRELADRAARSDPQLVDPRVHRERAHEVSDDTGERERGAEAPAQGAWPRCEAECGAGGADQHADPVDRTEAVAGLGRGRPGRRWG